MNNSEKSWIYIKFLYGFKAEDIFWNIKLYN